MAVLTANNMTLADITSRLDPNGKIAKVAEILNQTNEMLEDAVFTEGNLPTGDEYSQRTGLPLIYYRSINQGVPNSKSTSVIVKEATGMMEGRSMVDTELAKLNGSTNEFLLSENKPFIEAMNQAYVQNMLYGNPANDNRQILGVMPRYSAISGAGNAQNLLDAGGTGSNNASILLMGWGEETVSCLYPKGSIAGLEQEYLGERTVLDANGNQFEAHVTKWMWKNGVKVKDWRYIVRICNVNITDLLAQSGTQSTSAATQIINLMSRAMDRIPSAGNCRLAFYMPRTLISMLRIAALNKSTNALSIEDALTQFGHHYSQTKFLGVPVRKVDQMLLTEARVA